MDQIPPVRLEVNDTRDTYKVIYTNEWPVEGTRYVPLYLDAATASLSREPVAPEAVAGYASDGSESAVFDVIFDAATDIVGNTKLKLWVSTEEGDDMDLFVGLKKFDDAGEEVFFYGLGGSNPNDIVARGWLRVSHRELDPVLSKPWQPVLRHQRLLKLKPGEIVPVEWKSCHRARGLSGAKSCASWSRDGASLRTAPPWPSMTSSTAVAIAFIPEANPDSHVLIPVVEARTLGDGPSQQHT